MGSGEQGGPRDTPIYSAPQSTSSTTLLACGEVGGGGGRNHMGWNFHGKLQSKCRS